MVSLFTRKSKNSDLDEELRIVLQEHVALGKKLWRPQKRRGAVILQESMSITRKVWSLNHGPGAKTWLDEKAAKVIKFYKNPFWWLNPLNWGKKAKEMSRDRLLCIYAASRPHLATKASLQVAPIQHRHDYILKALSGFRLMFVRWGKTFKKRNKVRRQHLDEKERHQKWAAKVSALEKRDEALALYPPKNST